MPLGITRPTYCDDWSCPVRVSCAKHWGRSHAYAAMAEKHKPVGHGPGTHFFRGIREQCDHYEFDRQKKWLAALPGQITHL